MNSGDLFLVAVALLQIAATLSYGWKRDWPSAVICGAAAAMNLALIWKNHVPVG